MIVDPNNAQEEQLVEVEMSPVMRAQVLELCSRAYDKGWRDGVAYGFQRAVETSSVSPSETLFMKKDAN